MLQAFTTYACILIYKIWNLKFKIHLPNKIMLVKHFVCWASRLLRIDFLKKYMLLFLGSSLEKLCTERAHLVPEIHTFSYRRKLFAKLIPWPPAHNVGPLLIVSKKSSSRHRLMLRANYFCIFFTNFTNLISSNNYIIF